MSTWKLGDVVTDAVGDTFAYVGGNHSHGPWLRLASHEGDTTWVGSRYYAAELHPPLTPRPTTDEGSAGIPAPGDDAEPSLASPPADPSWTATDEAEWEIRKALQDRVTAAETDVARLRDFLADSEAELVGARQEADHERAEFRRALDQVAGERDRAEATATALAASGAHTYVSNDTPGAYPTMPQGHLLLGDGRRSLVVLDGGGPAVWVGGIRVTEPEALDATADHLRMLSGRLRERTEGGASR